MASLLAVMVTFGTFDGLGFNIAAGVCFVVLGCVGALWRLEVGSRERGRDWLGYLRSEQDQGLVVNVES